MSTPDEVYALWQRLEAWAAANAAVMLSELRGPAEPEALARFEAMSDLALPEGLRASLLLHDGEEGSRYCCAWADAGELFGTTEILEHWHRMQQMAEEPDPEEIAKSMREGLIEVEGPVWAVACHKAWIPFMALNGGDVSWYVDLVPAPGGTPGQVIEVDLECGRWRVRAPSFEAFLADYVGALEGGEYPERDPDGMPSAEGSAL